MTPVTKTKSDRKLQFEIDDCINSVAHYLPNQFPIKDFIHHNTLHAFQHLSFHAGVQKAAKIFGARAYMPTEFYAPGAEIVQPQVASENIRQIWLNALNLDLDGLYQPLLFKLLANFLDQGIALWRMPHTQDGFWRCLQRIAAESFLPLTPLTDKKCQSLLHQTIDGAIYFCLQQLVGDERLYQQFILQTLLTFPGWAGMVRVVEKNPHYMQMPRSISLKEVVAVVLILQYGWLRRHGKDLKVADVYPREFGEINGEDLSQLQILHDAYEWKQYTKVLSSLEENGKREERPAKKVKINALFCIDDREHAFSQFVEEIDETVATYCTPGFFAIDFVFQSAGSKFPSKQCPLPVQPKYFAREIVKPTQQRGKLRRMFKFLYPSANTMFRGWLITQTLGFWASVRLFLRVFQPFLRLSELHPVHLRKQDTELVLLRTDEKLNQHGLLSGYSIEEMAERVYGLLASIGLVTNFGELVVLIAHGSGSANNPHFAAYDCGACSGRPGAPNARAFAIMANNPKVRKILATKGLHLPTHTFFLGGLHNTATDTVTFFDCDGLPANLQPTFLSLQKTLCKALEKNAQDRCRNFEMISENISPQHAIRHVQQRADAIFEPRPEYNHVNNAYCIVGRRAFTEGVDFERRSFFQSYNYEFDTKGEILARMLGALVPVCGGINLEYFFSKVDNEVYGAGTKLSHNVVGLIGVANGVSGDLRTGLPAQMVDIHKPIRLLMVIEQLPAVVLSAIQKNNEVYEWIVNQWIHLIAFHPKEKRCYRFSEHQFAQLILEE